MAVALLGTACGARAEPSPRLVFEIVAERLALMKDVALHKERNALAVEDVARERVVLARAQDGAWAAGLDPRSVAAFYRAQIQAAKAIQYRYLAEWSLAPPNVGASVPDLAHELRPRLLELGEELVGAMKGFLEAGGCFGAEHRADFLETLAVEHLTEAEEDALFASMAAIDLVHPVRPCVAATRSADVPAIR